MNRQEKLKREGQFNKLEEGGIIENFKEINLTIINENFPKSHIPVWIDKGVQFKVETVNFNSNKPELNYIRAVPMDTERGWIHIEGQCFSSFFLIVKHAP